MEQIDRGKYVGKVRFGVSELVLGYSLVSVRLMVLAIPLRMVGDARSSICKYKLW